MSKRKIAVKGTIVLFSLASSLVVFTATYNTLQSINPAAAVVAITVAIIGIAWFKKTTN